MYLELALANERVVRGRTVVLDPLEQVLPSIIVKMRQRRFRQDEIQLGEFEVWNRENSVVGHWERWMSE